MEKKKNVTEYEPKRKKYTEYEQEDRDRDIVCKYIIKTDIECSVRALKMTRQLISFDSSSAIREMRCNRVRINNTTVPAPASLPDLHEIQHATECFYFFSFFFFERKKTAHSILYT